METIELTKEQLSNMRKISDNSYESTILEYKDKYVIKYFKPHISLEKLKNKKLKLLRIAQKNIEDNIITNPLSLINVDDNFCGYLMKKEKNSSLKSIRCIDTIFEVYIKLFKNLDYLHDHDICIGDLKPENIITPEGIFCDVDSMGVDELELCYPYIVPTYAYSDPKISYKLKKNERKTIDYLLLIYSLLNSLDNYRGSYENYICILERLCFSKETEKIIKKFIKKKKIKTIPNFSKVLLLERNLYDK